MRKMILQMQMSVAAKARDRSGSYGTGERTALGMQR